MKNLFFAIVFSFALLGSVAFAQYDENACIDGTPAGTCANEKPKYCTVGLNLESNIDMCGCPEGMVPNVAKTLCIKESESALVGELYFISGSPFDAYSVNPIAYVENPIYKQRAEAEESAPLASADATSEVEDKQVAPEAYLPKTTGIEGQEIIIEEAGETPAEEIVLDSEKEMAAETEDEASAKAINEANAAQEAEAGVADEQNMDSNEVVSEQIKSVYIKEEPTPSLILQQDEKSPADEARDKLYMLVALAIIAVMAIYYWMMPKNL